jgi:putative aminopeptidase FrvX
VSDLASLRAAWDEAATVELLLRLLETPSPTGFTEAAVALLEGELGAAGVAFERNRKGDLRWRVAGEGRAPVRALAAHVDTLGAIVKEVKRDGRLRLANVGGYDWTTVEGAEVTVYPLEAPALGGTVVNVKQSTHVHGPRCASWRAPTPPWRCGSTRWWRRPTTSPRSASPSATRCRSTRGRG